MDAFMGEIRAFTWNYPPQGWALCDGSSVSIRQQPALAAIIGYIYGGNQAQQTFNLPNLQGRVAVGVGQGLGLTAWTLAEQLGVESVTLTSGQCPAHNHPTNARISGVADSQDTPVATAMLGRVTETTGGVRPTWHQPDMPPTPVTMGYQMVGYTGGQPSSGAAAPHENRQPVLVMNYCLCLDGEFPTRN